MPAAGDINLQADESYACGRLITASKLAKELLRESKYLHDEHLREVNLLVYQELSRVMLAAG